MCTHLRAAHLTMPVPSKAVQQDGNLRDASTYGYDAPSRFHKWALAGLLNPNVLELVHQTNPPKHEIMQIVSVSHSYAEELSGHGADETGSGAYTCSFQAGSKISTEETSAAPSSQPQVALTAPFAADETPGEG